MGRFFSIGVLAAALAMATPLAAIAAGLGRLTVLSPLGQPLNAEIEIVSLQPGEEDGLAARLASVEAYRQAGIEINPVLAGMRFTIQRREGRTFVRMSTPQPVNEPFLELLVELEWNTGRLVREYTFLLDPPEYKGPAPIAAAPAKPTPPVAKPLPPVEAKPQPKPAPAVAAPAAPGTSYEVKRGDTLANIARQHLPAGVTLNQMLIAIYRANQDAFIRDNINLVRAGRILNIPGGDALGTVDAAEAQRLVREQAADFAEYRSRLAAAPTRAEGTPGQREATGRIDKPAAAPPGAPQDRLRLSKADPAKPAAPGTRAARGDDLAARERALKEAQSRITDLEKNVSDLQKLLEIKNQQLAELEKKAGVKPTPAPAAPPPVAKAPDKPAPAPEKPKPAPEAPKPEAPKPEAAKPEPAKPEPAKPAAPEAPKPAPAPEAKKPEAPKPKPKAAPPPPPPPEPSLIDEFLDNPIALGGLGGVVLLLVVYGAWAWRRKKATQARFQDSVLGAAAAGAGVGAAGAVAGAPAVGAPEAAPVAASQPAAGMEAEEVDPIAEADVYMAYGRDTQAEEILKEALQKDPSRIPVHAKLLEIYANRKDTKSFEQSALKLKGLTNGTGPEWEKASALGRSIDPGNGLYGGSGAAPAAAAAAGGAAPAALDFDLGAAPAQAQAAPDIPLEEAPKEAAAPALDFDLGAATTPGAEKEKTDFTPEGTLIMDKQAPEETVSGLDFDLGEAPKKEEPKAAAPAAPAAPAEPSGGLDFDLNLDIGSEEKKPEGTPEPQKAAAPAMDLSDISLDLGTPGEAPAAAEGSADPKWQEVATKLDLAKAYEEMGDKDGARELLNEVMKDGDAAQKGQAEQLLAKLG